jgi:hypothetical protein
MATPIPAFAVTTGTRKHDLELQIIYTDKASAIRERDELRRGYGMEDARVKAFVDETAAYEWVEKNS